MTKEFKKGLSKATLIDLYKQAYAHRKRIRARDQEAAAIADLKQRASALHKIGK